MHSRNTHNTLYGVFNFEVHLLPFCVFCFFFHDVCFVLKLHFIPIVIIICVQGAEKYFVEVIFNQGVKMGFLGPEKAVILPFNAAFATIPVYIFG